MSLIDRICQGKDDYEAVLSKKLAWSEDDDAQLTQTVSKILEEVRNRGDAVVLALTNRFDSRQLSSMAEAEITMERCQQALESLTPALRDALETAAKRIRDYHQHQKAVDWSFDDEYGNRLGQRVTPIEKVGIYVPGGKASYPSSVLMNAIPAKVAGVNEIIMVSPTPNDELNPLVMAAAALVGVDRFFTVGGAQAVGALTFGTDVIPAVDKIVGPGNKFVAEAKRQVFGRVGLDMVAGPSEVLIIADDTCEPDWLAMDMFAQSEHDEDAQAILIATSDSVLDAVEASIEKLLPTLPREKIVRNSLASRGLLVKVDTLESAIALANKIAPEHLELAIENAESVVEEIKHAGAVFIGKYTPESFGDYCAGPNHVLPTSMTARFSSPLGVYDFQKRTSLIHCTKAGARSLSVVADTIAQHESLDAHAISARLRGEV